MMQKTVLGKHYLIELHGCTADLLENVATVERILVRAAQEMNATIVMQKFHAFSPVGVSGMVVIEESHLSIHTWPEWQYAAVDVFTCGQLDVQCGIEYLVAAFKAEKCEQKFVERGVFNSKVV